MTVHRNTTMWLLLGGQNPEGQRNHEVSLWRRTCMTAYICHKKTGEIAGEAVSRHPCNCVKRLEGYWRVNIDYCLRRIGLHVHS